MMSSSTVGRVDESVLISVEKSLLSRLQRVNQMARCNLPCLFQSSSRISEERPTLKIKAIMRANEQTSVQALM
jgi:hypothetical protein